MAAPSHKFASKKFAAYLISEVSWKLLLFYTLSVYSDKPLDHYGFLILVTMVVTSGFVGVGYILGQAAIDKYVHLMESSFSSHPSNGSTENVEPEKRDRGS
jgi:hypothetical protein